VNKMVRRSLFKDVLSNVFAPVLCNRPLTRKTCCTRDRSEKFVESHGERIGDIGICGQESNNTTWRLCKMNLAVRGIDADVRWNSDGSFHKDELKDLRFDLHPRQSAVQYL
jgi:N-6 DNA Methylase